MTALLKTTAIAFCTAVLLCLAPIDAHAAEVSRDEAVASHSSGAETNFYSDFQSAVDQFNASGGTLKLERDIDVSLDDSVSAVTLSGNGTFDLNGYELKVREGSAAIKITSTQGNITITDSSASKTGKITGGASYSIWHEGAGNVTIESGTYQNFIRYGNGSLIINGGTFENNSFGNPKDDGGNVVLNGGTFNYGIWFTGGQKQTVFEILGDGKTYQKGDQIWPRKSIEALGEVYEFEKNNAITVTDESNIIASFSDGNHVNDKVTVYYYASLAAAIDKAKGSDAHDWVTLLKDSDEDVSIEADVCMVFEGESTGTFTFTRGNSIYLKKNLPSGMTLSARNADSFYKLINSAIDVNTDFIICPVIANGVSVTSSDVTPAEPGVKAIEWGVNIHLAHEHEWEYELADNAHTVHAFCKYPVSCTEAEGTAFATVTLSDTTVVYNGNEQSCRLDVAVKNGYTENLLDVDDIFYYDANTGEPVSEPTEIGVYTAKVTFGGVNAKATLTIKAISTADDFRFEEPSDTTYDGKPKHATIQAGEGAGEITLSYYDNEGNLLDGAPVDTGTYSVKISVAEGSEYVAADGITDESWQFNISPRLLTVDAIVEDKHYDGTSAATIASAKLKNVVEGEEVGLTNGVATFDSVQPANNIGVSFTNFVLTGEEDVLKNYVLIQPTGVTASIIDNPETSNSGKGGKDNIAATGDNANFALLASIVLASLASLVFVFRKLKQTS